MSKIDFVITWVDGNDPKWLQEKEKYVDKVFLQKQDVAGEKRYTDNGLLRYWFRGVEKYAPWVHRIYFVTYGHLPEWLNTNNPKLTIVNHRDFLPDEYRPTFSSVPLNLNLHRISGLSEEFVYFNDDMFLVSPCEPELFFQDGKPRDMAVQDIIPATAMEAYWHMVYNDIILLNQNVNKKRAQRDNIFKWLTPIYGKNMIKNLLLWKFPLFSGIYETHLPAGYLKSVYEEVWEKNYEILNEVSKHKTRNNLDVSENFIRYYQLASGKFKPINKLKTGRYCSMKASAIADFITSGKYKYLCINDEDFGEPFIRTKAAFDKILPEFSSFEKEFNIA